MKAFKLTPILVLFLLATSCERILDQKPLSDITQANFWNTPKDAEAGLIAVYNLHMNTAYTAFQLGEIRSDNLEMPTKWGYEMVNPQSADLNNNILSPVDGIASWVSFFNVVSRANEVLFFTEKINFADQVDKNRVLGEAYFLRAHSYFTMAKNWGAVPLITLPFASQGEDMYVERTPVNLIYDQIIKDLEQAETLLPVTRTDQRVRATKGAAQALFCDVLLTRGYSTFAKTDDFAKAIEKANLVIANTNYKLVSGAAYASIFRDGNSSESIFELAFNFNNLATHALSNFFLPRAYNKFRPYGGETLMLPSHSLVNAFEAGDLRAPTTFTVLRAEDEQYYDANVKGMTYGNKYLGTVTNVGVQRYSDDNYIIYRLPDVMLMKAEALVQTGNLPDAVAIVTQIRARAGLAAKAAATKDAALALVLDERKKELAFEGKRWYDLMRTNKVSTFRTETSFIQNRFLLPVPQAEVDRNAKLLPQNPTY
ncbi:RagB/SusD family nutrient uptake outer membrane protein [Dyadobacter sp. CY323]|uniref:RagB/SusD family nutrient uptake outer membrane protein n=1 Tax=Dyadobacter sp. CY323 TaxID=2907302 RepID=UPI001F37A59D|nr:RagB/SusD family nutrient uptake outer membrane protein [Dyadobacter sp. CY323]MCE6989705.1 RagB/SusD family nutrient uptake outer membrane protein [Dyadobacter sp. CY323]